MQAYWALMDEAKALPTGLHPLGTAGLARELDGAVGVCAAMTASPQIHILLTRKINEFMPTAQNLNPFQQH